jgi:hypothetical protein
MIDSCIEYKPITLGFMLKNWDELTPTKLKNRNVPVPSEIYEELLSILRINGENNTICFRFTVSSDAKPNKYTKIKLKLICFINNNIRNYPYFLAGLLASTLIPMFIYNPILMSEISSLFFVFFTWYILYILLLVATGISILIFLSILRSVTPIKHPHYLYLSLVHSDALPTDRIKIEFKDNESFYGKNNNYSIDMVINEGLFYSEDVTQQELSRILRTIQYANLVQFV